RSPAPSTAPRVCRRRRPPPPSKEPPMVEYNPFNREIVHNPFPVYKRLRDEAPVYHNPEIGVWALARYEDVIAAHLDTDTLSSAHGVTIEGVDRGAPFLIVKDPPEHTLHRKIVARMFTPRRIARLEPFVRATAAELLDRVRDADRFDLVQDFSFRLPLEVISELIGIPVSLRERVHELSDRIAARTEEGTPEDAYRAGAELWELLAGLVRERRRDPGDDVITLLMNTQVEDEDGRMRSLSDEELAFRFLELAFAGHETVAKLIPNGAIA